jgi:hypothetical protein
MNQHRVLIAPFFALAVAVAGCSQQSGTALAPSATNTVNSLERATRTAASPWPNLYVLNFTCPDQVTVYPPGQTSPSRSISLIDCPRYVSSIAFDAHGNLYASVYTGSRVRVYAPGSSSPFRALSLELKTPSDLVVDHLGRVFVANDSAALAVYAPGENRILRTLPYRGTPQMLVDSENYFYLNMWKTIEVYSPGGAKDLYQVQSASGSLQSEALDPENNLYVINYFANSIIVYKAHSNRILRTISKGLYEPWVLQFDASGNLYCGNATSVTVYAPGTSTPSRTIKDGIDAPNALAIDPMGNLYVSNSGVNDVTVYPPGTTTPSETITTGIDEVKSLSFGP